MRRLAAVLLLLLSCNGEPPAGPGSPDTPDASPSVEPQPPPGATIRLVADDDDPAHASYLEGVRFAADEVNASGSLSLQILRAPSVQAAVGLKPAAILAVGDPAAVTEARPGIEAARVPVILMGGDLYSTRELFRYAFQTSIPYSWQARVMASYFIEDRGHDVTKLLTTPSTSAATESFHAAWAEEGGALDVADVGESLDSLVFVGSARDAGELNSGTLADQDTPPQLGLSSEALDVSFASGQLPTPGTVTCYSYTWSGWADMIPRVHDFRERFAEAMGHYPASFEQEGYDAVKAVSDALIRTGGEGGDRLVQELETFRDETYSSVPVRLGPDDHVFAEQSHLGLFAVEEPVDAALPPPEASSLIPWRPILRTFTTDGEKMNFLDRDKKIFFPFWQPKRPTPKYWRAEYGIISRPSDPLH